MFSTRTLRLASLITTALLIQSGCAMRKKKEEKPAPAGPKPVHVGTISLVNPESGFVLIDNGLLPSPPPDMQMRSFTDGVQSAELTSSHVRKRPFVIADIRSGLPKKGDRVFTAVGPAEVMKPQGSSPSRNVIPQPVEPEFLPQVQLSEAP